MATDWGAFYRDFEDEPANDAAGATHDTQGQAESRVDTPPVWTPWEVIKQYEALVRLN